MAERLRKQCDAFNEYEALDALPQDATPVELEENGYPVVFMGERFCRMRKDDGVICGAKVQTVPLLHKHFSDVHKVDSNLKPATKAGNPKKEVLEAAVVFYENFMQNVTGKPPGPRPASQKRKADSERPKQRATKKQKGVTSVSSFGQLPFPVSSAASVFQNAPVPPTATAVAPVPSSHTKALNGNKGEERPPADAPDAMSPPIFSTSAPVPSGPTSIAPSTNGHAPVHRGPNDPAPLAMHPTGSHPPTLPTPAHDPPPVAVPPTAPAPNPPATPEVPIPQDDYTQTYIRSYNNGYDDCERAYKDQMAKLEAEKEAFAREKAQFQNARARFAGTLRQILALVENR